MSLRPSLTTSQTTDYRTSDEISSLNVCWSAAHIWTQRQVTAKEIRAGGKYVVHVRNKSEEWQLETVGAVSHFHSRSSHGVRPLYDAAGQHETRHSGFTCAQQSPAAQTRTCCRGRGCRWSGLVFVSTTVWINSAALLFFWGVCFVLLLVVLVSPVGANMTVSMICFKHKVVILPKIGNQKNRYTVSVSYWIYCGCIIAADTDPVRSVLSQYEYVLSDMTNYWCNFMRR